VEAARSRTEVILGLVRRERPAPVVMGRMYARAIGLSTAGLRVGAWVLAENSARQTGTLGALPIVAPGANCRAGDAQGLDFRPGRAVKGGRQCTK
jgi:hypothetical protein